MQFRTEDGEWMDEGVCLARRFERLDDCSYVRSEFSSEVVLIARMNGRVRRATVASPPESRARPRLYPSAQLGPDLAAVDRGPRSRWGAFGGSHVVGRFD
jgi:hypothetical protein